MKRMVILAFLTVMKETNTNEENITRLALSNQSRSVWVRRNEPRP